MTEPAKAGHHLVGDVDHPVFAAHLQRPLLVAGRGHDHAARGEHRLGDEAGDLFRAELQDLVLEIGHLFVAERFQAHALGPAVGEGDRQVVDGVGYQVEILPVAHLPGNRGGEQRAAVIGFLTGDDVLLFRLAGVVEIKLHEAQRRVVRGRSAGGEKHAVEVAGREFGELGGELGGRRRCQIAERRIVGHGQDLVGDGFGHLPAAIADLGAPHAAGAVDVFLAVGVVNVDAFRLGDDERAFLAGRS